MSFPYSSGDKWLSADINNLYYRAVDEFKIGGDGSDGALNVSAGTTNVSGVKNYTTITVANGATLNIQGPTILRATGAVSISGAITSDNNTGGYCAAAQGQPGSQIGSNSQGVNGGWAGFEWMQYQYSRIPFGGGRGGPGGAGASMDGSDELGGCGGGGGAGALKGGDSAQADEGNSSVSGTYGGDGGDPDYGLIIEAVGDITFASTADIDLKGGAGGNGNANGGGGGGAGGSSFQCLTLGDLTFTASANINVSGGAGGNGQGSLGSGGGGGGGGLIKFWYLGSLTDSGTTVVTGGAAGGGFGSASAGENGIYATEQLSGF